MSQFSMFEPVPGTDPRDPEAQVHEHRWLIKMSDRWVTAEIDCRSTQEHLQACVCLGCGAKASD